MFSSDLILLDVLYRGYAQQPPVHFQYHCLDVNGDLSFRSKYSPTLAWTRSESEYMWCQILPLTSTVDDIVPGLGTVFRVVVPYTGKVRLFWCTHQLQRLMPQLPQGSLKWSLYWYEKCGTFVGRTAIHTWLCRGHSRSWVNSKPLQRVQPVISLHWRGWVHSLFHRDWYCIRLISKSIQQNQCRSWIQQSLPSCFLEPVRNPTLNSIKKLLLFTWIAFVQ